MKKFRSLFSLLLVAVLIMTVLPSAVADVRSAVDVTEEDTYVFGNKGSENFDGHKFQYESMYAAAYDYNKIYPYPHKSVEIPVYSLYNPDNGKVVPAYCLDILTGAYEKNIYRKLNLEDSSYAASVAGSIRAILENGFYVPDGEDNEGRARERLNQIRAAVDIPDLNFSEVISATQCALWRTVHGAELEFGMFVRYSFKPGSTYVRYATLCQEGYTRSLSYTNSAHKEEIATITARIQTVYDYLLSLEPISGGDKTVSPSSFTYTSDPIVEDNGDGTYNLTVCATVDVNMTAGDVLVVKAWIGDDVYKITSNSQSLADGEQYVEVMLTNVPAYMVNNPDTYSVKLSISGYQTARGYFLFDAAGGGRDVSQTMVGYDDSQVAVYAEVKAQEMRVFSVYKTAKIEDASGVVHRYPLSGIVFDIYKVASMGEYEAGFDTSRENASNYTNLVENTPEFAVVTDKDGKATLNFTHLGMEDGVYLVVERNNPAVVAPEAPFFIVMPSGNQYTITVEPKNTLKDSVQIEKDVISLGSDSASLNVGDTHTWIISATIPSGLADAKSYVITDRIDSRLDYEGNLKVQLENQDGTAVTAELTQDTDYTLTVPTEADATLSLALTSEGKTKILNAIGTGDVTNYMLRIYFDTKINNTAEMGTEIPNQATLKYINSINFTFEVNSDEPKVTTGGLNIKKVDGKKTTQALPGAEFEIYRLATTEEMDAYLVNPEASEVTYLSGVSHGLVKTSFYNNANLTGDKVTTVTTDSMGAAAFYGLAYGTYYLVETKAPEGYNPLAEPIQVKIDATSHLTENTVLVENVGGTLLPATGGMGTDAFTIGGITLMGAAMLLLLLKKRRYIA